MSHEDALEENDPGIMSYAPAPDRSAGVEHVLYRVVRVGIVLVGLLVALATLSSHLMTPHLLYDKAPGPPALRDRLPQIILGVGVGLLLCIPHGWTQRSFLFWPRLMIYVLLAGFVVMRSAQGIAAGLRGGDPLVLFAGFGFFACIGLAFPLTLLWSRRFGRATRPAVRARGD
jgi:hypothetical protein